MQDTAYTTHTYKHTTIGFLADIKDMPNQYAYSKIFFDRWYRPENCTIVVTGDVKHDELVALVKASLRHVGTRARRSVTIPAEPPQTRAALAHADLAGADAADLYLGYHIPAADPDNPDTAALGALDAGGLRRDQPALPGAGAQGAEGRDCSMADAESKRDPGLFTIVARVRKPEDLADVRQRIAEALAEAARTPDRRGAAGRDQVAPALRVRRLARQRRRRGPRRRRVDRDHRAARRR